MCCLDEIMGACMDSCFAPFISGRSYPIRIQIHDAILHRLGFAPPAASAPSGMPAAPQPMQRNHYVTGSATAAATAGIPSAPAFPSVSQPPPLVYMGPPVPVRQRDSGLSLGRGAQQPVEMNQTQDSAVESQDADAVAALLSMEALAKQHAAASSSSTTATSPTHVSMSTGVSTQPSATSPKPHSSYSSTALNYPELTQAMEQYSALFDRQSRLKADLIDLRQQASDAQQKGMSPAAQTTAAMTSIQRELVLIRQQMTPLRSFLFTSQQRLIAEVSNAGTTPV